jgi:outer membrane protein
VTSKTACLLLATTLLAAAGAASAQDFTPKAKGTWVVDYRLTDVSPDEKAPINTSGGVSTGLHASINDSIVPTLGVGYFLTDNVALDLTLGTSHHKINAVGTGVNVNVHDTWVLPPVLTVQYHFNPKGRFSPYVGTGPNYMLFYSGEDKNGYAVKLKSGFGWAAQAGADYALKDRWSANIDVKKVFYSTTATINGGALTSHVKMDPWVVSAGFSYRY